MANKNIRTILKLKNITMWQLAKQIGISEPTITRWFRTELTPERYEKVTSAIQELSGGEQS
jgi:transcriptional regulator with XRE-family HTH domain